MEIITYKTNISSEAELQRVTPFLNNAVGSPNWQIDLRNSDKMLTVYSPGMVNETQLLHAIRKARFKAINLDDYYAIY